LYLICLKLLIEINKNFKNGAMADNSICVNFPSRNDAAYGAPYVSIFIGSGATSIAPYVSISIGEAAHVAIYF
ncbi:MAG TPA: hypothetical protein PK385_10315, partial [Spirochaetota bacterium]|nr:hypothetical protein [Spirochaetota bacterium]HOS33200.1 hypothetical protein [Spirochaetota bacterium]HOS56440.1 hypothetical protein [Spirochaetota bacterium]